MPNGTYPQFITKFNRDLLEFLKNRPDIDLEALDHATPETPYDLSKARSDELIHDRSGDRIFIMSMTGIAYVRTRPGGPKYKLRLGFMSFPFKKLFLSNTAQPGKQVSIIIGYEAFIEFASAHYVMKMLNVADLEINPATLEKQDSIIAKLDGLNTPISIKDTSTGAALSVKLDVKCRKFIEVFVKSSAAATFKIYGAMIDDAAYYRESDEIPLTGAGSLIQGYWNAKKYVKVETEDTNNNEIEITAS